MAIPSDQSPEFVDYCSEFARVCPEAVELLTYAQRTPTELLRQSTEILRTLPDGAGLQAATVAWRTFVDTNPSYVGEIVYEIGGGVALGPPPAPVTVDDYYRAVLLMGMSAEDARQIADDSAPDLDQPGAIWVGDTLLYVALLSPEHEERIRNYLKVDADRMARELDRVRRSIADRERRSSNDRDRATSYEP